MVKVSSLVRMLLVSSVVCCSSLTYGAVNVLTFNEFDDGQIVDNEYFDSFGVSITSVNYNNADAGTPFDDTDPNGNDNNFYNLQVAFDTLNDNSEDNDLEFNNNNNDYNTTYDPLVVDGVGPLLDSDGNATPGNILILHEEKNDGSDCANGETCLNPDDEGARAAGYFEFTFLDPVSILSMDIFDLEDGTNQDPIYYTIYFYDSSDNVIDTAVMPIIDDGTWTRQIYNNINGVLRMVVNMPGSGGIDNLAFKVTEVSAPQTAAILLLGIAGLVIGQRRTAK